MCAAIGPSVIALWPDAGKVLIGEPVVGNQPGLRSGGAEHESLEFLLAKVLDHLQSSTSAIVSSASTRSLSGARSRLTSRGARIITAMPSWAEFFSDAILGL